MLRMKFVCTGILLVMLLVSALAVPAAAWPVQIYRDDDAKIFHAFNYYCFSAANCVGSVSYVGTYVECCVTNKGGSLGSLNFQCFNC